MASMVPVASRVNWAAVGLQMVVLLCLFLLVGFLGLHLMFAPVIYLSWSWGTKRWLARDHRRSIGLIKAGRYAEAIPHCEASVATRKFLNHLRPSFTYLPRWNISS
jgi:hypothetical protein